MYVCLSARIGVAPTERISVKFGVGNFYENQLEDRNPFVLLTALRNNATEAILAFTL